jgi:hypothetical protein
MKNNDWVVTDPSCNQMYKTIVENQIYLFREDRTINPETGETEVYESLMDINDYDIAEMTDALAVFGYASRLSTVEAQAIVREWVDNGENIDLILECLFELET